MRRADDVFFFTLIDFLLQVFFFGLLLFVIGQAQNYKQDEERIKNQEVIEHLLGQTGFSTLTELTDFLTRLAPPDKFRGIADFFSEKKKDELEQAMNLVQRAGGFEEVRDKLKAFDEKYGLKPCLKKNAMGKVPPSAIFTIADEFITLDQELDEFSLVMKAVNKEPQNVKQLSLEQFRQTFSPLRKLDCKYHVAVVVKTKLLEPMESVQTAFRTERR